MSSVAGRIRDYFLSGIWQARPRELPRGRAALDRASRIAYSTVRGYFDHQLTSRAASLTYFTILSIVPFLAFAFAVLKGFGAYRTLIDGTVRPYLAETFGANPPLHQALERILDFVDRTDVSKLGALGLLLLVYTSVSLVSSVEVALNRIWGARATRPFLRQVTDYTTLLVTAPILMLVGATFSAAAQSSRALGFLRTAFGLGPVIDFLIGLTPVVVVGIALFAIYVILPNVRTRIASAAIGAAIAAMLWQAALVLHVQSQMGVARYNALYSVLGAIPIFLVWTWVSWLIVLVGGELAASHQNEEVAWQRHRARSADQRLREDLAIAAATQIARDFLGGGPRRTEAEIAELLDVPPPVLEEVLGALVRTGLLARTVSGRELGFVPGRDIDAVRAIDLRDAVRHEPRGDDIRADLERRLGPELERVLRAFDDEAQSSPHNLTLRELAEAVRRDEGDARPRRIEPPGRDGDGSGVLDAKEPNVPA